MVKNNIEWDSEAEQRINKAPFFVRKRAKGKVEEAAIALDEKRITVALMEKIKKQEMGE